MEKNLTIIQQLLKPLNITIESINDISNIEIDRDELLSNFVQEQYDKIIPNCKELYNSARLTSLHGNKYDKQKFSSFNLLRQILKCNSYILVPKIICLGYSTKNGQKLIKRSYIIKHIQQPDFNK